MVSTVLSVVKFPLFPEMCIFKCISSFLRMFVRLVDLTPTTFIPRTERFISGTGTVGTPEIFGQVTLFHIVLIGVD